MDWFIGAVIIITLVVLAVLYIIHYASQTALYTAEEIQASVEDFKLPKIKLLDLAGYAGYQTFEMAKPGIQSMIGAWVKEQQKGKGGAVIGQTEQDPGS